MVTQPTASSGLGGYIGDALKARGHPMDIVDARSLFWPKVWPALSCFCVNREQWFRRRWETGFYSVKAWQRNTRLNGRLLDRRLQPGGKVLQVGKEYFPHPRYAEMEYYLFILFNLRLALADGLTPWIPAEKERPAFLELERELFQQARHVFVGGEYVKRSLAADYAVAPDRVTVAGGGVHSFFLENPPGDSGSRLTHTCLFVGWAFGLKGGPAVIEGFAKARQQIPELKLVVVGPDPSEIPSAGGVIVAGPVRDRAALLRLYREADLFIMPSLRDSFGFVFLEAMSQGVPCIGADLHAMPEIIADGATGYIVPPRDAGAVADAIVRFYRDPENKRRMGAEALHRVRERFTWARVAEKMAAVMCPEPSAT